MLLPLLLLSPFVFAQEENLQKVQVLHQGIPDALVEFVPSVKTLEKEELKKRRENTLGDTLRNEVGVQTTSFGPNASRPIIRGLDGDRIRILQNGLGTLDASTQSVDHAVPVDTLIIDSIEVVRGPMSLLYGSSAVGGVVNMNTNRIHKKFEEGSSQDILIQGDSAQDALSAGAKLDYGQDQWMIHADAGYRNANDLRIPKPNKKERANDLGEMMNVDKLTNSGSVQKTAGIGASRIFNKGYAGLSYYFFDQFYGTVAEESVDIKMKQDRLEFHGEYYIAGDILKSIRFKTAQADYGHKEFESGAVGTTFTNEGNESRLELMSELSSVKGITGLQTQFFNFSAVGEEAYLPTSRNQVVSLFTLQEMSLGSDAVSFGARAESGNVKDESSAGKARSFVGYNGSLGYKHAFSETHQGNIALSYTERLPNFQELFAEGFHVASGTYEEGSENLKKEKAFALDTGLKYKSDSVQTQLNFFAQDFKDYITLFLTNEDTPPGDDGDLKVSGFKQIDALFYGVEFEGKKRLGESALHVTTKADFVRGLEKGSGDNLPRISPPRVAVGLELLKDRWSGDVEAQYNFEQHQTAENESRTKSFTLLNAGLFYQILENNGRWSLFGRVKNLLNQEARLHTSTLKDIAPLAGRSLVAGAQYTF
jgi:iron complex outermembrane receptor protein